jgi:hypothetical protein
MGERRRYGGGPAPGNSRAGSAAWAWAVGVEARLGRLASRARSQRALPGGSAAGEGERVARP